MEQYLAQKARHPGAVLLFQMGDFFETFFDDAARVSKLLGIALTSRELDRETGNPVPLAGFPVHALDSYLPRLIAAGCRVAICEQTEDPAKARKLVRREVTEVITPGTLVSGQALEATETALLASFLERGGTAAAAFCDLAGGTVDAIEADLPTAAGEMLRRCPREILLPEGSDFEAPPGMAATVLEPWRFEMQAAVQAIHRRLGVSTLEGLGLEGRPVAAGALGALLSYIEDTKRGMSSTLEFGGLYSVEDHLVIDRKSALALDLVDTAGPDRQAVLAVATDRTTTPGGSRLYRSWLLAPPRNPAVTSMRHDAVEEILGNGLSGRLAELMAGCADLERQSGRLLTGKSNPRDLAAVAATAALLPSMAGILSGCGSALLAEAAVMDTLDDIGADIRTTLASDPPLRPGDGRTVARGVSEELDSLRDAAGGDRSWIAAMEAEERLRTGIPRLSIGYNRVFGYFIEVPASASDRVPDTYTRRQTLSNAERYSTPELREAESRLSRAEERVGTLEREIFEALRYRVASGARRVRAAGAVLSTIDVLCGMAAMAAEKGYVRPSIEEGPCLVVEEGRNPVLDVILPRGECVPNSVRLDADRRILIVTGPNMAGKSTCLRQAAQMLVMAQAGSFVPAVSMRFSPMDRLFTRIGSADRIVRGQSTFLLEMADAASILNSSTPASLAVIDEIGRGTSTYDGLALAWAMIEHMHDHERHRPLVLFATHYHELTRLGARLPCASNASVQVRESRGRIVFLYRLAEGPADRSYGLHVAAMAGVPVRVVSKAARILARLEREGSTEVPSDDPQMEIPFEAPPDGLLDLLRAVDPDSLAPVQALKLLYDLKAMLG